MGRVAPSFWRNLASVCFCSMLSWVELGVGVRGREKGEGEGEREAEEQP